MTHSIIATKILNEIKLDNFILSKPTINQFGFVPMFSVASCLGFKEDPMAYSNLQLKMRDIMRTNKHKGHTTFDKTKKPIKDWCIKRAYELHGRHPSWSKEQITVQLCDEIYDKKWPKGVINLTDTNAHFTIKNKWLPKGKPSEWPIPSQS